jgi:cobaltochelatase CobN
VVNPKWLGGIKRHGYKGGLELAATVDYIFGYDATSQILEDWMYEALAQEYTFADDMQEFLEQNNPWALNAICERLLEAASRGMWVEPKQETIQKLKEVMLRSETMVEERGETVRTQ